MDYDVVVYASEPIILGSDIHRFLVSAFPKKHEDYLSHGYELLTQYKSVSFDKLKEMHRVTLRFKGTKSEYLSELEKIL